MTRVGVATRVMSKTARGTVTGHDRGWELQWQMNGLRGCKNETKLLGTRAAALVGTQVKHEQEHSRPVCSRSFCTGTAGTG